ncbi:MAG: ATP-dependent helicase [Candidatus Paceibacterota bacterium]
MKEANFKAELAKLNPEQRQAVETIEGPVMVIAGPGTGKTQILTLRIANILLQTDMQPENILALTFTESGAKAMRERLKRYVGTVAYRVPIYTFHGFAQHLISTYPEAFSRIIGGRPATDIEKVDLMESILNNNEIKILRPMGDKTYYVPSLIRIISSLKQEYIKPDDLVEIIAKQEQNLLSIEKIHQKGAHKGKVRGEYVKQEKVVAKNRELLFVYKQYEQLLKDKRIYDFDDMIIETVQALKSNSDLLLDLQETYQYVLADEHQDVNGSQNKILEYLTNFHESPNIFVVGDEKQAIFRFQGASLENFLYFMDLFPTTTKIVLTENYRSGQTILDAAHSLVRVEDDLLSSMRVPLEASLVKESLVCRRDFSHEAVEDDWLVKAIGEKLSNGTKPEEIAVIVRTNREVELLAERLQQKNIPVFASADGDILDHPITESVQALIDFVLSDVSEEAIFKVLHGAYWGLPTSDLIRIASARSFERSLTSILTDRQVLTEIGVVEVDKALTIMTVQSKAREMEVYAAPHRVFRILARGQWILGTCHEV